MGVGEAVGEGGRTHGRSGLFGMELSDGAGEGSREGTREAALEVLFERKDPGRKMGLKEGFGIGEMISGIDIAAIVRFFWGWIRKESDETD